VAPHNGLGRAERAKKDTANQARALPGYQGQSPWLVRCRAPDECGCDGNGSWAHRQRATEVPLTNRDDAVHDSSLTERRTAPHRHCSVGRGTESELPAQQDSPERRGRGHADLIVRRRDAMLIRAGPTEGPDRASDRSRGRSLERGRRLCASNTAENAWRAQTVHIRSNPPPDSRN